MDSERMSKEDFGDLKGNIDAPVQEDTSFKKKYANTFGSIGLAKKVVQKLLKISHPHPKNLSNRKCSYDITLPEKLLECIGD